MTCSFRLSKIISIAFILITFSSCVSVEKYNLKLEKPLSVAKLQNDIDYVQHKLEKLHPNLYKYISKNELNQKFDSVRNVINKPMTSKEFFFLVSPIIASVHQGHMVLSPLFKLVSKKEQKRLKAAGVGPLSQFDFEWMNDKLFVIKNRSKQQSIKVGAEILSINKITPQYIHDKFRKTITSDGLNTTYLPRAFSRRFPTYITSEIGINDSLSYVFKQNDSVFTTIVSRIKPEKKAKVANDSVVKLEIKKISITRKEKRIYGYDETTKTFSKSLSFIKTDSTIALLKIRDFSNGNFKKAYTALFQKIKNKKIKTLIIDLRNNPGGKVGDVVNFYSYLTDNEYTMLQKAVVTSKTSLWKLGVFKKLPIITYPFAALFYPLYMGFSSARVKKENDGTFTYGLVGTKMKKSNVNNFKGKIYVIINGTSFSASCLLSAMLKRNPAVTFVGEETGGGFNSTVAGLLPVLTLPNTKLPLRIGLMDIKTTNQTSVFGHGIYPDKEIVPTLKDRIEGKDPELDWIITTIKNEK